MGLCLSSFVFVYKRPGPSGALVLEFDRIPLVLADYATRAAQPLSAGPYRRARGLEMLFLPQTFSSSSSDLAIRLYLVVVLEDRVREHRLDAHGFHRRREGRVT